MAYRPYDDIYLQTQSRPSTSRASNRSSKFIEDEEDSGYYKPLAPSSYSTGELRRLEERDAKIKQRIRMLKIVSRTLAVVLSALTVTALAVTLAKYFETSGKTYDVNGEQQGAFPEDAKTIYIYVYFGISTVSLILNGEVLLSYCWGYKRANTAASIASWWAIAVMVLHIAVWIAGVVFYRYGKHKVDGKWKDLWGYTCSKTADEIQYAVKDIHFATYCAVQTASYYIGIINVGASILTALIYIFTLVRLRGKKQMTRVASKDEASEPLREF